MRFSTLPHLVVGWVVATSLAGCQTFTPIERDALSDGAAVRITLTREEALRQADAIGELTERLEGRVTEGGVGESLALTVPSRGSTPAAASRFNSFLSVPWQGIAQIEEKRTSWARTGVLAAVTGVVVVVILSVTEGSSQGGPGEGPGDNSDLRLPLFRLAW